MDNQLSQLIRSPYHQRAKFFLKASAIVFFILTLISGCQSTAYDERGFERMYDFDHQVHYRQKRLGQYHYLLEINSGSYEFFATQSVFLLRVSDRLCAKLTPQITILKGIQDFERLQLTPRPYQPNLIAELKCL